MTSYVKCYASHHVHSDNSTHLYVARHNDRWRNNKILDFLPWHLSCTFLICNDGSGTKSSPKKRFQSKLGKKLHRANKLLEFPVFFNGNWETMLLVSRKRRFYLIKQNISSRNVWSASFTLFTFWSVFSGPDCLVMLFHARDYHVTS